MNRENSTMTISQMAPQLSFIWAGAFKGSGLTWKEHEVWQPDRPEFKFELYNLLVRCSYKRERQREDRGGGVQSPPEGTQNQILNWLKQLLYLCVL